MPFAPKSQPPPRNAAVATTMADMVEAVPCREWLMCLYIYIHTHNMYIYIILVSCTYIYVFYKYKYIYM